MVSFVSHVTDVLRGAAMAVADSVPGVSGGTIAFLLGFYERFIWSVHALLLGSFAEKKAALPFLVKLGCGWVCCFLVCAVILSSLFDMYIYEICSVFLGLTIAAVPIVIAEEREALQGRYLNVVFAVIGGEVREWIWRTGRLVLGCICLLRRLWRFLRWCCRGFRVRRFC